jgi:glycosyltransferase involved in cell wall biosynthesis
MQILTTSYEYPPVGGGGAKVVHGITARLAARGHQVDLLTMGYRGLPAKQDVAGVAVWRVTNTRRGISTCSFVEMLPYVLLAPFYLLKAIRCKQYAINHTHFIFPGGVISYILKRFTGLPYVITAHGSDVPNYNPHRFRLLHHVLKPLWRKIVCDADLIMCPSRSIEDLIKQTAPTAHTCVIPNAIDTGKFRPRDKRPRSLLVVTRMLERKGVQYTLRALADLQGQFDVNIVGDGPYLPALKRLAAELNVEVRFWGHLDNDSAQLKELYETASIFVFTSEAENCPIVLLEAMIAGAAVITSTGTGCADVVADSGLLVPVRDAHAIKLALGQLSASPELTARLGRAARAHVIAHFGWDEVIDQLLEVYRRFEHKWSVRDGVAAIP